MAAVGALAGVPVAEGAEASGSILELLEVQVDVVLNSFSNPLATGTVGGKPVHVTGSLYSGADGGPGAVTGSLAGQPLSAVLTLKDQVPTSSGSRTTARLTASVGHDALALTGIFSLDENFNFVSGRITGSDRAVSVNLSARPYSWAGNTGSRATLRGTYAGSPIAVTAKLPTTERGSVTGRAMGKTVDLDVHAYQPSGTRVTGTFSGPAELLAVILGTIAFFA